MSVQSKREYVQAIYERYRGARCPEKRRILDEFCQVTRHRRKHAIRLLSGPAPGAGCPPQRRALTYSPAVIEALRAIWEAAGYPWSLRLKACCRCGCRGRPYKKDDIEQKNWTHVRKLLGYVRYDTPAAQAAIHDLYRGELRLLQNLFLPSVKLLRKERVDARVPHDRAATRTDLCPRHLAPQPAAPPGRRPRPRPSARPPTLQHQTEPAPGCSRVPPGNIGDGAMMPASVTSTNGLTGAAKFG